MSNFQKMNSRSRLLKFCTCRGIAYFGSSYYKHLFILEPCLLNGFILRLFDYVAHFLYLSKAGFYPTNSNCQSDLVLLLTSNIYKLPFEIHFVICVICFVGKFLVRANGYYAILNQSNAKHTFDIGLCLIILL